MAPVRLGSSEGDISLITIFVIISPTLVVFQMVELNMF